MIKPLTSIILGYKSISKVFFHSTTVRTIIHKLRKRRTEVNLPMSGRSVKITPWVHRRLIQEVTKNPLQHLKNWKPQLLHLRSKFMIQNKKATGEKTLTKIVWLLFQHMPRCNAIFCWKILLVSIHINATLIAPAAKMLLQSEYTHPSKDTMT